MQLMVTGLGVQDKDWTVSEPLGAGFSRLYYILSGEVFYNDNHLSRKLSPGKLYVFPAQRSYFIEHDPAHPIECLWFHIDLFPYDFDRLVEFDFSDGENRTLAAILQALLLECGDKITSQGNECDELYRSLAESLTLAVCRHPAVQKPDPTLLEILGYLRANLSSPTLDIHQISENFGYSTEHFIRRFRDSMKTTPYRYLTALRMSAAAQALTENHTVSETAAMCGYSDVKSFSRAFKKNFGVPPSDYIRFYRPQA